MSDRTGRKTDSKREGRTVTVKTGPRPIVIEQTLAEDAIFAHLLCSKSLRLICTIVLKSEGCYARGFNYATN